MPAPSVHPTSERLYESLGSGLTDRDAGLDYPLLKFIDSFGELLGEIDDVVKDSDDGTGWSSVFDVDRIEVEYLPYLAQFVGARLPVGLTEQAQRDYIKASPGFRRGTKAAMMAEARATLTPDADFFFIERQPNAYGLTVQTRPAETPDPTATEAALRRQKPAGIVLNFVVSDAISIDFLAGDIDSLVGTIDSQSL